MLDDFFLRAMLAGIGVALVACPLGCFIVWRRMAYFGDTTAHAALLGVALGIALGAGPTAGVFAVTLLVALLLVGLLRAVRVAADTLLGILSHAALSIGLVVIGFMTWVRIDLMGYLFGDVLAVGPADVYTIGIGAVAVLAVLTAVWRPLVAATVDRDLARAEGVNVGFVEIVYVVLLAVVVAIAMKIVGILLVTSLLIIPAAASRAFAATPERMAVGAAAIGVLAVVAGLNASWIADTPAGPSIVTAAFALFLISLVAAGLRDGLRRRAAG
ncbi:zinc transport system permease protein [Tepidamorphus gemmatus]|uniref:High-affinity zinc uptake system membrane protein ZnuB n=1 Tax=Tepidamorphus gemmatus TaxID=747076 RepID=A0A4R3MH47_9HYPH|nr:metal ABC transporter permease [Tepidamorphus gemmatus]TCT12547.1 zinc transport system permease protein [Tepidamorphus gemmatus]